jgi:hypothetical protein
MRWSSAASGTRHCAPGGSVHLFFVHLLIDEHGNLEDTAFAYVAQHLVSFARPLPDPGEYRAGANERIFRLVPACFEVSGDQLASRVRSQLAAVQQRIASVGNASVTAIERSTHAPTTLPIPQ